jgi:hypothetical protein
MSRPMAAVVARTPMTDQLMPRSAGPTAVLGNKAGGRRGVYPQITPISPSSPM